MPDTPTTGEPTTHPHPANLTPGGGTGDGTINQSPDQQQEAARRSGRRLGSTDLPEIPGYEVLGVLGRGGMGAVYHARQLALNRDVALKVVLGAERAGPRTLVRFLAEAEAVAAVRHPHVVQVYEYGDHGGLPYIALEYLAGGTLADRLRAAGRLDPRAAAGLVEKLARGVAAAHDRQIVHRDVKPSNILFDPAGEPKVADFGLAKRAVGADLTTTGAVMGTPAYMSPEQAGGRTKFVGPPADVWALGVILYECLVGARPFDGETTDDILEQVRTAAPRRPRDRQPAVPRDLEVVCLKCLAKDPRDRYSTATELADDLRRFLDGRPVTARPVGTLARLAKWVRRNPVPAAVASVALATTVTAVVFGFVALDSDRARLRAEGRTATEQAKRLQEHAAATVRIAVHKGNLRQAVGAYDDAEAGGLEITPEMRFDRLRALFGLSDNERLEREFAAVRLDDLPEHLRGRFELWKATVLFGTDDAEAERLVAAAVTRPLPLADREYAAGLLAATTPAAVEHFRAAVRHDVYHQPARSNACLFLLFLGRLDEAADLAEQSAELFPEHPDYPAVLAIVAGLRGDEARVVREADRLAGRVSAEEIAGLKSLAAAMGASSRALRGMLGYEPARFGDAARMQQVEAFGRVVFTDGVGRAGRLVGGLPRSHRDRFALYVQLTVQLSRDQNGFMKLADDAEFLARLDRAGRAHPEGFLLLLQTLLHSHRANRIPLTPATADEVAARLRITAEVAGRAAEAKSFFPFGDIITDAAFGLRGMLGNPEFLGDRADPAETAAAVVLIRRRLRAYGDFPTPTTSYMGAIIAIRAREYTLARQVLDAWDRKFPRDVEAARQRAHLEYATECYPRAVEAAEFVLAKHPDDAPMAEIRAAARGRFVPRETAPPPRPALKSQLLRSRASDTIVGYRRARTPPGSRSATNPTPCNGPVLLRPVYHHALARSRLPSRPRRWGAVHPRRPGRRAEPVQRSGVCRGRR